MLALTGKQLSRVRLLILALLVLELLTFIIDDAYQVLLCGFDFGLSLLLVSKCFDQIKNDSLALFKIRSSLKRLLLGSRVILRIVAVVLFQV